MRIQTNIQAANAFRNYNKNTSALSKNLEKLSSGYRINRAGDDAAGLAISEKMRAQVTGLDAAGKNVKDGISLIKTAEGALQEVQDMMNRMTYLATQSANGTYDNEVDRANLQKEVEALKTEIDRIADSSNFNGQKLLNGELGSTAASSSTVKGDLTLAANLQGSTAGVEDYTAATKAESKLAVTADATNSKKLVAGDSITLSITGSDDKVHNITLTISEDTTELLDADGNTMGSIADLAGAGITADELATAFGKAIEDNETLDALYDVDTTSAAGTIALKSKAAGADAASVKMFALEVEAEDSTAKAGSIANTVTKGVDAYETFNTTNYLKKLTTDTTYEGWDVADAKRSDAQDAVFEINGEKFAVVHDQDSAEALVKEMGSDVNVVIYDTDDNATATALTNLINLKTGLAADNKDTSGTATAKIALKASTSTTAEKAGGMTLQIGDSAEEYNQMKLSIGDTHAAALGLDSVDISTLEGAQSAIESIKAAINTVSATRGDLGALQNRLEYTQNNLSIMKENFTDAESSIRDTDVADEMTAYTKNNILLQSAQAMLAQANQMPQGVLQLLQ